MRSEAGPGQHDGWRQQEQRRTRAVVIALLAGLGAIVYGNLSAWYGPGESDWAPSLLTLLNGAIALLLLATGWAGVGWWGTRPARTKQLALGVAGGLVLAAVPVLSFLAAPLAGEPLQWDPATAADPAFAIWRLLVAVPVGVALFEEVLFRGWLHRLGGEAFGPGPRQWAYGLVVFTLWHLVVSFASVSQTQYGESGPLLFGLAWVLALLATMVGGAVFLWLRVWTGGLAAPVVAHWVVNTTMTLVLIAIGRIIGGA